MEHDVLYAFFITISLSISFIIMLAACLCCRKKIPKASNAPHRSLPDIPIAESLNDNGSELYATVADKVQDKPQGRSPTPSLKKQTSVSQHSSISQADDVSSPYARVKTPPHDYDNVLTSEHPYAQLHTPGPSTSAQQSNFEHSTNNSSSRRGSHQSLLGTENQQEIPAASAIAGMISASQDLPYMTPPIISQPHFSGDSQDSSKGYTSISVREPIANILAQTGHSSGRQNQKNLNDSHYATVSDDSDEMYAAIDDPKNNNQADVYTSGSETYAQIQPANPITVSVEINTQSTSRVQTHPEPLRLNIAPKKHPTDTPNPPPVDSLKAQMHSRQASSSSNTSSVGNIGSPKPEKRQANSPLPPTPKNLQYLSNTNLTSTSSIPSGRNSVASVIDCQSQVPPIWRGTSKENVTTADVEEESPKKKDSSPSKDIEGMYAKVNKKNRFSNSPSQNASPILNRKSSSTDTTNAADVIQKELNIKDLVLNAIQASPDQRRPRSSSYETKDHGYETIPADKLNTNGNMAMNRKSDGYAQVMRKETKSNEGLVNTGRNLNLDMSQPTDIFRKIDINLVPSEPGYESLPDHSGVTNDPGYETLLKTGDHVDGKKPISDYDPNYEVLRPTKYQSSDDGYAKVWEKFPRSEDEGTDGYSRVKENNDLLPGYSSIAEKIPDENHDYASISDDKKRLSCNKINNNNNNEDTGSDLYSSILLNEQNLPYLDARENPEYHNYQTISETKSSPSAAEVPTTVTNNILASNSLTSDKQLKTPSTGQSSPDRQMRCSSTSNTISSSQQHSSNYGSLTGSESDPNYESVRYLDSENPYERLHNDPNISPDVTVGNITASASDKNLPLNHNNSTTIDTSKQPMTSLGNSENGEVEDYFQV